MDGLTLKKLLRKADENGYAVPSFNYSDIWDFKAIVQAAEEEEAPVMIASNPLVVGELGAKFCAGFANAAMDQAEVPLIHLWTIPLLWRCAGTALTAAILQ